MRVQTITRLPEQFFHKPEVQGIFAHIGVVASKIFSALAKFFSYLSSSCTQHPIAGGIIVSVALIYLSYVAISLWKKNKLLSDMIQLIKERNFLIQNSPPDTYQASYGSRQKYDQAVRSYTDTAERLNTRSQVLQNKFLSQGISFQEKAWAIYHAVLNKLPLLPQEKTT
ncbi:MAG: hypothetical protein JW769_00810 [Parachlamydiales bacterium]|nr:hypothetical protein [Parachlamydiales bacterium]